MRAIWVNLGLLLLGLCLTFGCRTSRPNIKPPPQPETLTMPPSEARFNSPVMPAQAFKDRDSNKYKAISTPDLMPTRGPSMNSTGMNGLR